MNKDTILSLNNVSVLYKNGAGIRNVTASFKKGELVALVGSNGAGKSTLMNAIAGFQSITTGSVIFNDQFINQRNPYSILGFSPQNQVIDWYLNVLDNVMLGPLLSGKDTKTSKRLAIRALSNLSLEEKLHFQLDQLSGGQQQRVQIARAIAHEPTLYLLDEPTTGLDAESSENFLRYLRDVVVNNSRAALISSHDLYLLEKYCEKMIYIENGEIIYNGTIKDFINSKQQSKKYTIKCAQKLNEIALDKLSSYGVEVLKLDPLEIVIKAETSMTPIIKAIEKKNEIISIKSKELSLRETYLQLKRKL